jgi:hypothetical protein
MPFVPEYSRLVLLVGKEKNKHYQFKISAMISIRIMSKKTENDILWIQVI